ncbi:MAG: MFS transporter [Methanomicrobiales archaeon]|nr:MFS transporter [Methanomicrobiales archaeon]
MALSNAIVPVLPVYDPSSGLQGMIYSAYFLGAFFLTLPAGMMSDRFGRVPFIRLGLALTVTSGIFLTMATGPVPVLTLRFLEGMGAGLFVAAAMSSVNSDPDHIRMSGWLMASLNFGLIAGLLGAGWLASALTFPAAGLLLFTLIAIVPSLTAFFIRDAPIIHGRPEPDSVSAYVVQYRWLLVSSLILIGVTGVLTSLYPDYSGASPDVLALWIAGMNVATIAAVMIYSRTTVHPVPVIRWSAILMGIFVLISFYSPPGFLVIGALAGIVMIAQMAYLAKVHEHQGTVMGLFSTTSYLGMALMPPAAGFVADSQGFFAAFLLTALCAGFVAVTIGRCTCAGGSLEDPGEPGRGNEQ